MTGADADTDRRLRGWRGAIGQVVRYCLAGGANTLVDVALLNALLWRFPTHAMHLLVGYSAVAYAGGAVGGFFLHKYWTFGRTRRPTRREVRRFGITLALELLVNTALVWLAGVALAPFIADAAVWGNAAKLAAMAGTATFSYLCLRCWTFAGGSPDRPRRPGGRRDRPDEACVGPRSEGEPVRLGRRRPAARPGVAPPDGRHTSLRRRARSSCASTPQGGHRP